MSPLDALFQGSTILLAGGTGEVGRRVLARVLGAGGKVGLAVRRPGDAQRVASEHAGKPVFPVVVESGDGEAASGMVKGVEDALGPISALVCASGAFEGGPIVEERPARLEKMLEANLLHAYALVRAVVPTMRRRRAGRIVLIGSRSVLRGAGGASAYNTAKGALHAFASSLADELSGSGVTINLVAPAMIDTPANRKADPRGDPATWTPLDAVVDAVLFLASPQAQFLRGSVLVPTGS